MAILLLGIVTLFVGLLLMRNVAFERLLKAEDHQAWNTVMRPTELGFVNSMGVIPLFQWSLSRGFEQSSSEKVRTLGEDAFKRAKLARLCMLLGVAFIFTGFFLAIFFQAS